MPTVWLGLGWLAGIALASIVRLSVAAWLASGAAACVAVWVSRRAGRRVRLVILAGVALALGAAWYQFRQPVFDPASLAVYNDKGAVVLEGVVAAEPDVRDTYINLRLRTETLVPSGSDRPIAVHGLVLVRAPRFPQYGYGDRLRVYGPLETPPVFEDFSYADYLARQNIYSIVRAISGFNISILAGIFSSLATRLLGPKRGLPAALAAIALYTVLVGASASVVRAALMGGLVLIGRNIGRAPVGLSLLLVAAGVMTLINPLTLWDVGFQLSFFATLGLVLYAERFELGFRALVSRHFPPRAVERLTGWVTEFVLVTFAAQITTLPVILYTFQRFSLISFVANVFILPVQPAVMILSGIAVMLGLVWIPIGQLAAWIAWHFVAYTIALIEAFARVPSASVEFGRMGLPIVWGLYAGLFTVTALSARPADRRPAWWSAVTGLITPAVVLGGLGLASLFAWQAGLHQPDGRLHLSVFDVGDGDAVLIESPTGRRVLIDGGRSPSVLGDALGRRMPVWDRQIDWVIVAAPDEERVAGLAGVVGRFRVGSVLLAGEPSKRAAYRDLLETLVEQKVPVTAAETGQRLALGDDSALEVVAVSESGATLRVTHGRASFLLPIGLDLKTQAYLLTQRRVDPSSVMLLAAHESDRVNTREWVDAVHPWAVVLSASAGSAPLAVSSEVQAALAGTRLLRTDRDGWVEFVTDGRRLWGWKEK